MNTNKYLLKKTLTKLLMVSLLLPSFANTAKAADQCALNIAVRNRVDLLHHPLGHVKKWEYVIQEQTEQNKIGRLAAGDADLVVLDDPASLKGNTKYNTAKDIALLHGTKGYAGKPKVVLAYVDIGEAENYRSYWVKGWKVGSPAWIVAKDPDGWSGNFPVAYWDAGWQAIMKGVVERVARSGYDGIYMDWIEAFSFSKVARKAKALGKNPTDEMVKFIANIKAWGKAVNPNFLVVAQNASELGRRADYLALLDGEAQEQVFFDGGADVMGIVPEQGDCRLPLKMGSAMPTTNAAYCADLGTMDMSSEEYILDLARFLEAGVPVFMVDYAIQPANADFSYTQARCYDFIGLVTMRSLETLTATPNKF